MDPVTITITVADEGVRCESVLAPADIVFWLEAAKTIVVSDVITPADVPAEVQ